MPLKLRPTGLGSGHYKDVPDYSVFCGQWCIGRIYQPRTGPPDLRWFWALHFTGKPPRLRTDNRVASLKMAKKEFRGELEEVEGVGGGWRRLVRKLG